MQESGQRVEDDHSTAFNCSDIDKEELIPDSESQAKKLSDSKSEDIIGPESFSSGNSAGMLSSLKWISSYIDLLQNLHQQLYKIEEELVTVLKVSTLLLENQETPNNSRVQQISEILESIRGTRARYLCCQVSARLTFAWLDNWDQLIDLFCVYVLAEYNVSWKRL